MSWKVEVVTDDSGEWESECLRFTTALEALAYARHLELRCSAVRDKRIVRCEDPNWLDGESPRAARHDGNSAEHRKRLLSEHRAVVEHHDRKVDDDE
jgi:hypothetical protein